MRNPSLIMLLFAWWTALAGGEPEASVTLASIGEENVRDGVCEWAHARDNGFIDPDGTEREPPALFMDTEAGPGKSLALSLVSEELILNPLLPEAPCAHRVALTPIPEGNAIGLTYVHGFLTAKEAMAAVRLCDDRAGWTRSPQKKTFRTDAAATGGSGEGSEDGEGEGNYVTAARTSDSCPLIWPHHYRPHRERLTPTQRAQLGEELDLASVLSHRAALLGNASLAHVEPLQVDWSDWRRPSLEQ